MGRFVVEKNASEEYIFELRAANGEAVISGSAYPVYESCENEIDAVIRDCGAPVEDMTSPQQEALPCPKYEIFRNRAGYSFRLRSATGETVAFGQSYTSKAACVKGIVSVKANAPTAMISMRQP